MAAEIKEAAQVYRELSPLILWSHMAMYEYAFYVFGTIASNTARDILASNCIPIPCLEKSLHFFLNKFNKFKFTFTIFGTHYSDDWPIRVTKTSNTYLKIYLPLNIANVIMTSS